MDGQNDSVHIWHHGIKEYVKSVTTSTANKSLVITFRYITEHNTCGIAQ